MKLLYYLFFNMFGSVLFSDCSRNTVFGDIVNVLNGENLSLIIQFWFFTQEYTEPEKEQIASGNYNFDHPDAFDFGLLIETLQRLKEGKSVEVPIYNFKTHSRDKAKVGLIWKMLIGSGDYTNLL